MVASNGGKPWKKLGEILIAKNIITQKTVDRVLQRSQELHRRFGATLVDLNLVSGEELAAALAEQHGYKTAFGLADLQIDKALLAAVPVEQALRHLIFPLKRDGDRLAIAMVDPTDGDVLYTLSEQTGLKVYPFVTTREDIRTAISRLYLQKEPRRTNERTVLLVDDDKVILQMLTDILSGEGYRILTAQDGMEAFKIVIGDSPHVVITDMEMPKLGGYQLLNSITAIPELRHIPVIMITGKAKTEEEELHAFEKGFFDVIMKPFTKASVQARVRRAFHFYNNQYRGF